MRCIERIKRLAASVGATVDESSLAGGTLIIDAPTGYVWDATSCAVIVWQATTMSQDQSWWSEAVADAIKDMRQGLTKCDAEESERIEYERDEPWTAPADAPERLAVMA